MAWRLRWIRSSSGHSVAAGATERMTLATERLATRPPPRGGLRRRANQKVKHETRRSPPLGPSQKLEVDPWRDAAFNTVV